MVARQIYSEKSGCLIGSYLSLVTWHPFGQFIACFDDGDNPTNEFYWENKTNVRSSENVLGMALSFNGKTVLEEQLKQI